MKLPRDEGVIRFGATPTPCRDQSLQWMLSACILGSSMAFIDGTVVNVALPHMRLQLMVSHPDKHAGMGFLGMSTLAFAPIVIAVSAAIGATWRYQILNTDA